MRVSDIMKSEPHGTTRTAPDPASATAWSVPALLGHGVGSSPGGARARAPRREPTAERGRVDPGPDRRACQRDPRGRRHPLGPSRCQGRGAELEALEAHPHRPSGRPQTAATKEVVYAWVESSNPSTKPGAVHMRLGDNCAGIGQAISVERQVAAGLTTHRREALIRSSAGRQRGSASPSTG